MRLIFLISIITILPIGGIYAQQSVFHKSEDHTFLKAMELFKKEKYGSAQPLFVESFEKYKEHNSELRTQSQYYIAQCAVRLFNADAEYYTLNFISDNPQSVLVNDAYFHLAGYFYARKKWGDAIDYYQKTDYRKLDKEQNAEYYFKLGYSYFSKKQYEEALVAFYEIVEKDTKFTPPAIYYYAHIHYKQGNTQTALNGFLKLKDDKNFGPIVPYYIVQIYFKQEKYQDVIEFAPQIIDQVIDKRLAEVSRITAESHFRLGEYAESLPYFARYFKHAKSLTKTDKYQQAYAYYKVDSIDQAIKGFESISNASNIVGQSAGYYLADCYLKIDDKQKASRAFAAASRVDYDPVIRQDALFNYAMLTFELANDPFNESIRAFEEFINLYPESKRIDEAYKFLVQAYLNTKNYKQALASIERINVKGADMKSAYQRIAYNRGLELFVNQQYAPAEDLLKNSLKYGEHNQVLKAKALYWLAEAEYNQKKYVEAEKNFLSFKSAPISYTSDEFHLIDYNLGYCLFKQGKYSNSIEWFRKFATTSNESQKTEKSDAYNRIADCYYLQLDYYSAIDFYNRAHKVGQSNPDYALIQKAICEGLVNRDEAKVVTLQVLSTDYPQSVYSDDAWYESAQAFLKQKKSSEAISSLENMVTNYPNSELGGKAMIQLGLLYYNADNFNEAIKYYKQTVRNYPGTQESDDALFGLKNIYIDMNKVDEYTSFVNGMGDASLLISTTEEDSLTYVSAEKIYMSGDCVKGTLALGNYIQKFPQGKYVSSANFYKGDCHYRNKEFGKALPAFEAVIALDRNRFTEQALLGAARIEMENKNYEKAISHYSSILSDYNSSKATEEAQIALMECYYLSNKLDNAEKYAKIIRDMVSVSKDKKRVANFIIARRKEENTRTALAIEDYKTLAKEVMSKEGAESKYRLANLLFKQGKLDESEQEILQFSEMSTPHEYWIGKSFILWSQIFLKREDHFQSIQTLQSIIDYYENENDGIIEEAKKMKETVVALQEKNEQPIEEDNVEIDIVQ